MAIVALVNAISADVVAKIAAAGLPPLVGGGILLGHVKGNETAAPPRIVFTPLSFRWEARSPAFNAAAVNPQNAQAPGRSIRSYTMSSYGSGYASTPTVTVGAPDLATGTQATATAVMTSNGSISNVVPAVAGSGYLNAPSVTISGGGGTGATATANLGLTPGGIAGITQRALFTEWVKFEVEVWGVNSSGASISPDAALDYDATQMLYQQVIASTHLLAPGVHIEAGGQWFDALPNATLIDVLGHSVRFTIEIATPLLAEPLVPTTGASTQLAPANTQINPTNKITSFSTGTVESG